MLSFFAQTPFLLDPVVFNFDTTHQHFVNENYRYCLDDGDRILRLPIESDEETELTQWEKYCTTCKIWRPPRAHHCKRCGYCMVRGKSFVVLQQNANGSFDADAHLVFVCRTDLITTALCWELALRGTIIASSRSFYCVPMPAAQCSQLEGYGD